MPRWLVLNNAGRVGSSMQRKGGEGERAHRGRCREEGRGGRERCVGNSDACGSDDVSASVSDRESTRLATHHTRNALPRLGNTAPSAVRQNAPATNPARLRATAPYRGPSSGCLCNCSVRAVLPVVYCYLFIISKILRGKYCACACACVHVHVYVHVYVYVYV